MDRGRHFILIFALVGVFLVLVQRLIFHLLIPYTKAGAILQPAIPITPPRFYAAQLVGLALFLTAIAAGLWLVLGTPAPPWTRHRWPRAIGTYYLLHPPFVFLPASL